MARFLRIATPDYTFGSYRRARFAGYTLYDCFDFFEYSLSRRQGALSFADAWMKALQAAQVISAADASAYEARVRALLKPAASPWDDTIESLYAAMHRERVPLLNAARVHAHKMRQIAMAGPKPSRKSGLYQQAALDTLLRTKDAVLVIVSDLDWVPEATRQMEALLKAEKRVFLLAPAQSLAPVPAAPEWNALLEAAGYEALAGHRAAGRLEFVTSPHDSRGVDFSMISHHPLLQQAIDEGALFVHAFGEDAFLSLHDLSVPQVAHVCAQTVYSHAVLGIHTQGARSLVYLPPRTRPFRDAPIIEAPLITRLQYAALFDAYGEEIYRMTPSVLRQAFPRFFVNTFSDVQATDAALWRNAVAGGPAHPSSAHWPMPERAGTVLSAIGADTPYECRAFYHDHTTAAEAPAGQLPTGWANKTLINLLRVREAKNAQVLLIDDYGAQTFREYMRSHAMLQTPRYMSNFMFFLTPTLVDRYNRLRADRPREQLHPKYTHIDFFRVKRADGVHQSFPLYNKACIAKDADGRFHFFSYALGGGRMALNGHTIVWQKEAVNPSTPCEVAVYTPLLSAADASADALHYTRAVGRGRLNLVIIGEAVVCIRAGDVLLPSIGVVVSLSGQARANFERSLPLSMDKHGYAQWESHSIRTAIDLQAPAGISDACWRDMAWAYGGGVSLIRGGICIFDEGNDATGAFRDEGWLSPLSIQTQESKTHDETERHPRTLLGLNGAGELFVLVFSGRSRYTRGVTYREACTLARQYVGEIDCMVSVDGGASSFLGYAGHNTFIELSYPACTGTTGTGLVRRVNSVLVL